MTDERKQENFSQWKKELLSREAEATIQEVAEKKENEAIYQMQCKFLQPKYDARMIEIAPDWRSIYANTVAEQVMTDSFCGGVPVSNRFNPTRREQKL